MKQFLCLITAIFCLAISSCKRKYDDTVISGYVNDSLSGAPIHGVEMQLKSGTFLYGASKAETLTDANGYYKMVYDTPSEDSFSLPTSYEAFAVKPGFNLKRAEIKPGTNSTRDFQLGEKHLQVKITHLNYYNSDSASVSIAGEGLNTISDSWTCYNSQTPCPERNYTLRADTNLLITITRYSSGTASNSTHTKYISGDKTVTFNLLI